MGRKRETQGILYSTHGSTPNFMISFAVGFVFALLLFGAYTSFQGQTTAGRAFEEAISTPPSDKTCEQMGGQYCDDVLDCQGIIRTAFDTDSCCVGVCRTAPPAEYDIDGDGGISHRDLRMVTQDMITGNRRSDVNGDGQVDSLDLTQVAQLVAK